MVTAAAGVLYPASHRHEVAKLTTAELAAYYGGHPNQRLAQRKKTWMERGFADLDARNAVLTYNKFLQKMEMQLGKSAWLAGDSYSLADAESLPYIAILELLSFGPWWQGKMPRVDTWYKRLKERPSFRAAFLDVLPEATQAKLAKRGQQVWPEVEAILATAEPFTGRSPWAMRAEAL